jgi:hypothetical protein
MSRLIGSSCVSETDWLDFLLFARNPHVGTYLDLKTLETDSFKKKKRMGESLIVIYLGRMPYYLSPTLTSVVF